MAIRVLNADAVNRLLTYEAALDAMVELFALSAQDAAVGYGRIDLPHPNGWLRVLPGFIAPLGVFGYKSLNRADGVGVRYAVHVHDLDTGGLVGMVDALALTPGRVR